jgi:membrane-associated phospholipid phosphatase
VSAGTLNRNVVSARKAVRPAPPPIQQAPADDESARPSPTARLVWLTGATALFLLLYGGCLWATAQRAAVPSLYFAWERHIPYVPWMIWPYLSIDLFFLASFFVCRRRDELAALGGRLVLATVLAAACFLCFPLRYAFPIPPTDGVLGQVIAAFRGFDRPFNLAPSLHIAFRTILWVVYVRHTSGLLRRGVQAWFVLIGLSTLLVYQHHVVDVVGGLFLGMLCVHLVPEGRTRAPRSTPRKHWAAGYATGALALLVAAGVMGAWGYVLLWPALSLALVALAYATGNPDVFRKRADGRIPASTWAVHAPYLLGHRLAWWVQRRNRPATSRVTKGLIIGRVLTGRELAALAPSAVVDLTAEFGATPPVSVRYVPLPILDHTLPDLDALALAVQAVRAAGRSGPVYVHCALGYARSALVAAACLIASEPGVTMREAVGRVRSARPGVVFSRRALRLLHRHAARMSTSADPAISGFSPAGSTKRERQGYPRP